tara:strand:- start:3408 stop:3656 length:249 start_codon:yes stop_codon:yes gene_type:complete
MTEGGEFWKKRYEVLKEDFDMILRENADLFSTVREIKAHTTLGDIMSAMTAIKDLADRLDGCTPNKSTPDKPQEEGGYKWQA